MKLNRRALIRASVLSATTAAVLNLEGEAGQAVTTPFLAYSADSFFRSRVDGKAGRPLAPVDATRTGEFHRFMTSYSDQSRYSAPTIKGLGSNRWGTAFATGTTADPVWRLTGTVPKDVAVLKTVGFHAPDSLGRQLTGTSDSPFVVQDMAHGWSVWAAKATANSSNHTISVGAAGLYEHASNGLDKRNPRSDSTLNFRSRGAIPDGMVIRRDLVDYGIANGTGLGHVLHLFMTATGTGHCHPMVGDEGNKGGWGMEGERIFIRPDVDLTARSLSPFGLVIARTLQQHGAYLGDNAGAESTLKAEQTSSAHNPWTGLTVSATCLQNKVTWADLAVATAGWQ